MIQNAPQQVENAAVLAGGILAGLGDVAGGLISLLVCHALKKDLH